MSSSITRAGPAVAVATVLAAGGFLFAPLVQGTLTGSPRFFEWDVPEQYWPDLVYLCDSLHRGELPYWNPYDRGGYPYYADPQAATYHPTSWAICAMAGPSPSLGWASARVVFGFVLAGVFGLAWLRRLGASWAGATAGAVAIEAAPFMRHNWELNLTGALAYLPLVLWAADRLAVERRTADAALFALALALSGWMGSPPALWLTGTMSMLYLAFRLGEQARAHPGVLLRAIALVSLALALAAGLLAVIIVPGLELASHSVQAGRSLESIAEDGLGPDRLLALVWPQPGNHLYVGWLALLLGALALRGPRVALFFWGIAVAAVLLAMGTHGPLFPFAFEHVPGVSMFRLPHRYEAWLGPAFGALIALGVKELEQRLAWVRRSERWLGAALALIVLLDVTRALPAERHTREGPPPAEPAIAARVLAHAPGTRDHRFRVMDEFAISCRAGTRLHRRDLRGYQDPLLLASYERVVGSLREHPALAPQLNVRYALTGPHFLHGWNRHYLPPPDELRARLATRVRYADDRERSVIELTDALPLAYFVPAAEIERVRERSQALARLTELAPSALAVLEDEGPSGAARRGTRPRAAGYDLRLSADELRFTIDAPGPGVVVINETYYPGWRASVDGHEVPIVRANGLVRSIPIDRGRHAVHLWFAPADGRATRWILLASLAALGAIGVLSRRRTNPSS